jgi:hypothetical protein
VKIRRRDNYLKKLDSRFRWNDEKEKIRAYYEAINNGAKLTFS